MQTTIHSVFRPDAQLDRRPTDLILTSTDHVQFHVQRDRVVTTSTNCFNLLLFMPADGPVALAEDSSLLSIILHMIYNRKFDSPPSPANILASFDAFRKYGLPLKTYFIPASSLFEATRTQIRIQPKEYALEIYIRASQNDLLEVAKAASAALHSISLITADPEKIHQIHPFYLHKLYQLHAERFRALQRILRTPPPTHPWVATCGEKGQQRSIINWNIQTNEAILSSETPTDTPETIRNKLSVIDSSLTCGNCKATLKIAIDRVVNEWENTRSTI